MIGGFSISETGALAFRSNVAASKFLLTWIDRSGKPLGTLGPPGPHRELSISRDGAHAAIVQQGTDPVLTDVWLLNLKNGTFPRFTREPALNVCPVWSPDGGSIAFGSDRTRSPLTFNVYWKKSGGVEAEEPLTRAGRSLVPSDWSSDGQLLLCV